MCVCVCVGGWVCLHVAHVTPPPPPPPIAVEFRLFVDDLCVKNGVECPFPRTSTRLLDKVGCTECHAYLTSYGG